MLTGKKDRCILSLVKAMASLRILLEGAFLFLNLSKIRNFERGPLPELNINP